MNRFHEKAAELRAIVTPHYNCAQSVVIPFAESAQVDPETARRFAACFGGGMKRGSVCGAVTGGLMALGLFGLDDPELLKEYHSRIAEKHCGCLNCAELLKLNEEACGEKKPFCDGMVYECVELVYELLKAHGKITE